MFPESRILSNNSDTTENDTNQTQSPADLLTEARKSVWAATQNIVAEFSIRQKAMEDIANAKIAETDGALSFVDLSVIRFDREAELLQKYHDEAVEKWEDPELIKMLIWYLMYAGKMKQLKILWKESVYWKEVISDKILLSNLLELTWMVAKTYDSYGEWFWATTLVRELELDLMKEVADSVQNKGIAIDLWSANGTTTKNISDMWFKQVTWYEVCPNMIDVANKKNWWKGVNFENANLFEWIPHENNSVDFLVANFWSASEINKDILPEVDRVLAQWGKAILSFYNADSITESWWQPLQNGIEPILNAKSNILEVPIFRENESPKVYKIYAQPYSVESIISKVTQSSLDLEWVGSFSPWLTMAPPVFFDSKLRIAQLEKYEREHYYKWPYLWFYLTVIVSKK